MRPATIAVHGGSEGKTTGPLADPIVTSSTYRWEDFDNPPEFEYSRYGNPNREALERTVAALEGGKHAVAFASGMAAVTAIMELSSQGDHVLIADDIYGGTFAIGKDVLPRHGVEVGSFDPLHPESLSQAIRPNTRLVVFESPTNPNLRIADIAALAAIARQRGVLSVVDNTFATPLLQNPLSLGVDIVVHSSTKYLGGHSDVVGGVMVTNSDEVHARLLAYAKSAGGIPGPFDCWLVCRGIKSLSARMRVIQENAMAVAKFLESHSGIERVHYPGLASHSGHELASRQMRGFGGMMAVEVAGGAAGAKRFYQKLRVISLAASLGGAESLVSYPPVLSHKGMTEAERMARGIPPSLLRVSIGLEDEQDLLEDLEQSLT